MKLHRGKRAERAGYALVLFVMLFFGLMGLAALVIDMGLARLAQREMQTAVDSAALEGLRWQAASATNPSGPDPRQQASQMVAGGPVGNGSSAQPSMFADCYEGSGGTVQYGAGPVVQFTGGVGPAELAAAQTILPPAPAGSYSPVYQPQRAGGTPGLELNLSNAAEGDMVAGTYNPGQSSAEADDYTRADFTPAPPGSSTGTAFLVRMRRTDNINGLDQESGISSGGPTLPVLFGRGSMMARSGGSGQLSVTSGVTVRATAIAAAGPVGGPSQNPSDAGRAKTAGPPHQYIDANNNPVSIPGVTPFALSQANWEGGQTSFSAGVGGSITGGGQVAQPALIEIGQQIGNGKSIAAQDAAWLSQYVSANGTNPANYTGPTLLALSQYVPIVDANNTIIGFGYVQSWNWNGSATGGTLSVTMGPSGSQPVGGGNVSGAFIPGLTQDTADLATLFQEHAAFTNPLYAPVLVNHYIGPQ